MSEGWPELPKSMASSSSNRDTLDFLRTNFEPHEIEVLLEPSKEEKLLGGMFDFRHGRLHAEAAPVHFFAELGRDPITQAGVYIDKLVDQHGLAGNVVYIGDNLLTYALRFDLGLRDRVVPYLLEIPQHHYFVNLQDRWVVFISFEDDFAFAAYESRQTH
jgi:hypothetical protein